VVGDVPESRVGSQRVMAAFGVLLGVVAAASGEQGPDPAKEAFIPDIGAALRATFAHLRKRLAEEGLTDVVGLLGEASRCREVLRMLCTAPALVSSGGAAPCPANPGGGVIASAPVFRGGGGLSLVRAATWNIAGGHRSAQAPSAFSERDQHQAQMQEILRWRAVFQCDVVALQECEAATACSELLGDFAFVGSAAASASRGFVHLYVCHGISFERVSVPDSLPCVAVRLRPEAAATVVAAVHLPIGDGDGRRELLLGQVAGVVGAASASLRP